MSEWKPPKSAVEIVKIRTGYYVLAHLKVRTRKEARLAAKAVKKALKGGK